MPTTTKSPLRFETRAAATAWLKETGNFGFLHESNVIGQRGFIACQRDEQGVWAFVAADEMVWLPNW